MAKDILMDEMGIEQHHDAVTGTGKQRVADDYENRVVKMIKETSSLYSDLIDGKVK